MQRRALGPSAQLEPAIWLADYRAADVDLSIEDMLLQAPDYRLAAPAALLTTAEVEPLFRRYAWLAAQSGFMRRVFTDTAKAMEWVYLRKAIQESA